MIITLTCLVVSMTAGTVTLSWIEPAPTPLLTAAAQAPDPDLESLIAKPPAPDQPQWAGITIHHRSPDQVASSPSLTIGRAEERFHFIVHSDGIIRETAFWQEKVALNDRRYIAVCMMGTRSRDKISARQTQSLMRLLGRLSAHSNIPQNAIELDELSDPTKCPDLPPDAVALQRFLDSLGIAD
jgi:hypothetical protein